MFSRSAWRSRAARRFPPVLATALLTAAAFLLPATSHPPAAQASADGATKVLSLSE